MRLGHTKQSRSEQYQALFDNQVVDRGVITQAADKGEVYGGSQFHHKIGGVITRPTRLGIHGGDRKSDEFKNQAG